MVLTSVLQTWLIAASSLMLVIAFGLFTVTALLLLIGIEGKYMITIFDFCRRKASKSNLFKLALNDEMMVIRSDGDKDDKVSSCRLFDSNKFSRSAIPSVGQ